MFYFYTTTQFGMYKNDSFKLIDRFDYRLDKEEIFIFDSEISCIVDGVVQNNVTWFDDIDSHINKVIEPNTKVQGNFTFEVPKDTKTFDLKYKNTTIHIEI